MRPITPIFVGFLTLLAGEGLAGAATPVSVEIPPGCQKSALTKSAYRSGIAQGQFLVDRAWGSVNNCDNLERFTDIVVANVQNHSLSGSSDFSICRYTGLHDGVFQRLDYVWNMCNGECCDEGSVIGDLSARLYCQLSILLDGLAAPDEFVRKPVFLCGFAFQMCCDAEFFGTSLTYRGLGPEGDPQQCLPYTEDEYFSIWDDTRTLQCSYLPPERSQFTPSASTP